MMMLLTVFIIPHMGDGPFWASRIWPEADKCVNYWWVNLLAVSNFVEVEHQVTRMCFELSSPVPLPSAAETRFGYVRPSDRVARDENGAGKTERILSKSKRRNARPKSFGFVAIT